MKSSHYLLGLGVLAVVVIRIWCASRRERSPPSDHPCHAGRPLADAMHYALLYLHTRHAAARVAHLERGRQADHSVWLADPSLIDANVALSRQLKDVHEALATLGYVLIGLHAMAALLHHYVMRDTLVRMLPGHHPELLASDCFTWV